MGIAGGALAMARRMAGTDWHGAQVQLVRRRCLDRVGVAGIVMKETRGAVEVVGMDGRVRILGKEETVEVGKRPFEIYVSQMVYIQGWGEGGEEVQGEAIGEV